MISQMTNQIIDVFINTNFIVQEIQQRLEFEVWQVLNPAAHTDIDVFRAAVSALRQTGVQFIITERRYEEKPDYSEVTWGWMTFLCDEITQKNTQKKITKEKVAEKFDRIYKNLLQKKLVEKVS